MEDAQKSAMIVLAEVRLDRGPRPLVQHRLLPLESACLRGSWIMMVLTAFCDPV